MLGIRTAPRDKSTTSAAQHALGTSLMLPGQFIGSDHFGDVIDRHVRGLPAVHNRHAPAHGVDQLTTDMVFVRNDHPARPTLEPLYSGPYVFTGRHTSHFDVRVGSRIERINVHRLKPAHAAPEVQPAVPPKRGRPRKLDDSAPQPSPPRPPRPPSPPKPPPLTPPAASDKSSRRSPTLKPCLITQRRRYPRRHKKVRFHFPNS